MRTLHLDIEAIRRAAREWPDRLIAYDTFGTRGIGSREPVWIDGELFGTAPFELVPQAGEPPNVGDPWPPEAIAAILAALADLAARGYEVLLRVRPEDLGRAKEFYEWEGRYGGERCADLAEHAGHWPIPGIALMLVARGAEDLRGYRTFGVDEQRMYKWVEPIAGFLALPADKHGLAWTGDGELGDLAPWAEQLTGGVIYTGQHFRVMLMDEARAHVDGLGLRWLECAP